MITQYHRPATLEEAVTLVARPGTNVIVEGAAPGSAAYIDSSAVIDLQSLDLDGLNLSGETVRIGSMTTLADLAASPLTPPLISELAIREAPSTIRNLATVGGMIATNDAESELLAGLIAFNASVTMAWPDATSEVTLDAVLSNPQGTEDSIIIDVSIETRGSTSAHRTARTPMDRPIVLVVGRRDPSGHIRLAVAGMADHVVAVSPGQMGTLDPPSDFRGTSQYRKTLAKVLTERVLGDLSGGGF